MDDAELIHRLRNPHGHSQIVMRLEAADRIEALEARCESLEYALGVIANPDWTWATPADMREHASAALEEAGNGRG